MSNDTFREWDAPGVESQQTEDAVQSAAPSSETWWRRLLQHLLPTRAQESEQIAERLLELDEVIALYPDAAVNYVLRAELYLQTGDDELAVLDFRRGLGIAERQLERDRWGLVAQVVGDRARRGLEQAERRLCQANLSAEASGEIEG
jgi:hypothetical protein